LFDDASRSTDVRHRCPTRADPGIVGPERGGETDAVGICLVFFSRLCGGGSLEVLARRSGAGARCPTVVTGLRRRPWPVPGDDRPGGLAALNRLRGPGAPTAGSTTVTRAGSGSRGRADDQGARLLPRNAPAARLAPPVTKPRLLVTRRPRHGPRTAGNEHGTGPRPGSRRRGHRDPLQPRMDDLEELAPRSPSWRPGGSPSPARWTSCAGEQPGNSTTGS